MFWKKLCLTGVILLAVAGAVICTSDRDFLSRGDELSQPNYIHNDNMANVKIGGRDLTTTVLDASKMQDISYDSTYAERITAILKQKWGQKRRYKEFVSNIKALVLNDDGMKGCKEVYVSTVPVFGYDPIDEKVRYGAPWLIILSSDYQRGTAIRLQQIIGSYRILESNEKCSDELKEMLTGEKEDAMILICGRYGEYWLTSENEILRQPNTPEFEIKGDVYQKLSQSEIAVSKKKYWKGRWLKFHCKILPNSFLLDFTLAVGLFIMVLVYVMIVLFVDHV